MYQSFSAITFRFHCKSLTANVKDVQHVQKLARQYVLLRFGCRDNTMVILIYCGRTGVASRRQGLWLHHLLQFIIFHGISIEFTHVTL